MANYTDNLNLKLPESNEHVQLDVLNDNFSKIDSYCEITSEDGNININTEILDEESSNISYNKIGNICYISGDITLQEDVVISNKNLIGGGAPAAICTQNIKSPLQTTWLSVDTTGSIYIEIDGDIPTLTNPISFGFTYICKINNVDKEEHN